VNYYRTKYKQEKESKEVLDKLTSQQDFIIKTYKNKNDQLVVQTEILELQANTVKDLAKRQELQWLKEFEGLKKNLKNLESGYKLQALATDSVKAKLETLQLFSIDYKGDTIIYKGMQFVYTDEFTTLTAKQLTSDSINVKYSVKVPLSGVVYWHRKWFLGKKTYKAEVTSSNPNVEISEVLTLKIKPK
jgi:hypothetical protein